MFVVEPYTPSLLPDWNRVLDESINSTFLHARSFMEYHGNKFTDASLVIYKNKKPIAIFPAHRTGEEIHSHQGLSYGGFVLSRLLSMERIIAVLKEVLQYYHEKKVKTIVIKDVPSFYGTSSLEWMAYGMFILGAEIIRTDLTFAIPLPMLSSSYSKGRKWGISKAEKHGLILREVNDFRPFWENVLAPNLWRRHKVRPVHSWEEIQSLANNNPPYIRQFEVWEQERILAGTTIFETNTTAHTQYISSTPRGKELAALDLLMDHLIQQVYPHKHYFDFGIVNENQGARINKGLMKWKESFGAKPYVHQFYKVDPGRFGLLEDAIRE
jgi:hypothetical protein